MYSPLSVFKPSNEELNAVPHVEPLKNKKFNKIKSNHKMVSSKLYKGVDSFKNEYPNNRRKDQLAYFDRKPKSPPKRQQWHKNEPLIIQPEELSNLCSCSTEEERSVQFDANIMAPRPAVTLENFVVVSDRTRSVSECASEDSFIVFDEGNQSSSDDDESCFDESTEEESTTEEEHCVKKVHFPQEKELRKVYHIVAWEFAYRRARKGPWEELARDRERFKRRIERCSSIISKILDSNHRKSVYEQRFSEKSD